MHLRSCLSAVSAVVVLVTALASIPAANAEQCSGIRQRKEIRQFSQQERNDLFAAMVRLQQDGSPSTYDRFANDHNKYSKTSHGIAGFLPWHRAYLREVERALQRINPSVTLGYWDWTIDSQAPEVSKVFTADYYGGNGGSDGCITNGPFKDYKPYYPTPHCLRRKFDAGDKINAVSSPEVVNSAVQKLESYAEIRQEIENVMHGQVHIGIGGDMETMFSPNDPIFFAHHSFVDKIWADWQSVKPQRLRDYSGITSEGNPATANDVLEPYNVRVSDVFDTTNLCYTYGEL
ncbi:hypothetical protein THASP1DRAFT_19023, partial [Thamnocephalis sphaerospora]